MTLDKVLNLSKLPFPELGADRDTVSSPGSVL